MEKFLIERQNDKGKKTEATITGGHLEPASNRVRQ